jgi:hypothetical protein
MFLNIFFLKSNLNKRVNYIYIILTKEGNKNERIISIRYTILPSNGYKQLRNCGVEQSGELIK